MSKNPLLKKAALHALLHHAHKNLAEQHHHRWNDHWAEEGRKEDEGDYDAADHHSDLVGRHMRAEEKNEDKADHHNDKVHYFLGQHNDHTKKPVSHDEVMSWAKNKHERHFPYGTHPKHLLAHIRAVGKEVK